MRTQSADADESRWVTRRVGAKSFHEYANARKNSAGNFFEGICFLWIFTVLNDKSEQRFRKISF